jgi:dipeptidyl aminopeptidase/acylaminoacyl peptidase
MQVDDLFELEDIGKYYGGPYDFAPDGGALAFTRVRAKKSWTNHKWEYLWGSNGADVWLQAAPGAPPVNLTHGEQDGAGWWAPQWSPDGKRLTLLSTKTGDNVTLWVWQRDTGALKQLTSQGIDLPDIRVRPVIWVDERHVLCPVLPAGRQPLGMRAELQSTQIAMTEWPKTPKGAEVTSSVLESGVNPGFDTRQNGELLLIDVTDGSSRVVSSGSTQGWRLSPSGTHVAYVRQVSVYTPRADERLPFGALGTFALELRTAAGKEVTLSKALPSDVLGESLRWSPDGTELALLSFEGSREDSPTLFRVNARSGLVTRVDVGKLDLNPAIRLLPQLEWTAKGEIIAKGVLREADKKPAVTARRDWWLISADGRSRMLTAAMKTPPTEVWPQEGRSAFVGLADGELWRIQPGREAIANLTEKFDPSIAQLAWPAVSIFGNDEVPRPSRTYSKLIFGVRTDAAQDFHLLDLKSGAISSMQKPAPTAALVSFEPKSGSAIYSASDRQGTFAWRKPAGEKPADELIATNTFLRNIAEGEFKSIEYTALNGDKLKAWMLLPVGYQPGKRYPLLTWVYAGSTAGPKPPVSQSIAYASSLNMQIPAAHGYVVLFPSMPLKPEGMTDDPMLALPNGVLPAVDKAIELGIADPQRLFLAGQSFGGFSTYGLVTQTKRFTAAISFAGLSNLISLYGQFDARMRYTEYPHEHLFQAALTEAAQIRMGNPPWQDLGRYIRNSPVFFVDRVETPLMIVQGDLDYVALQQGEEFFMSLYRQGKRARFVRYWGEGHVLESPANVRDMWQQVFSWFDSFTATSSSPPR